MTKLNVKKRANTAQIIIEAIEQSKGFITVAAKNCGLSYVTVKKYVDQYPTVARAMKEAKESILDFTESKLLVNITKGDTASIIFYLKTQGKARGYIERQELTGAEGRPIRMEATIVNFDAKTVAAAILEAQRLGITPGMLGGNGHNEGADLLSSPADIQATTVPEPED